MKGRHLSIHHGRTRPQQLSIALEHASSTLQKYSSLSEQPQSIKCRAEESSEYEADRHRMLTIERDKLPVEIWGFLVSGDSSCTESSLGSELQPVDILNAAESRHDALVVRVDIHHVIRVLLSILFLGDQTVF